MRIPGARVGENHLVARLQAVHDFDRVDGAAAEFDGSAHSFGAARDKFENSDRAIFLAESGAADIDHVVEPFEFDRSIDAEVGARALWEERRQTPRPP